jgi:hypothetical protein
MAFRGKQPKRNKIVIDNKSTEQMNTFNYIGTSVSTFKKIEGIINNIFKPNEARKNTRIKLYSTVALPVLLYGSESWTIKAKYKAEMKSMRRTADGYILSDFK